MCRRLVVAVTTLTALSTACAAGAFAAGAPVRKAPVAISPMTAPAMTAPSAAPGGRDTAAVAEPPGGGHAIFGGCGRGRVRDPHTNQCHGPADVPR